jgi:hypothetical protein
MSDDIPNQTMWSVAFHYAQVFRITVKAEDEEDAIERAQEIYAEHDTDPFTRLCGDDDCWEAEPAAADQATPSPA